MTSPNTHSLLVLSAHRVEHLSQADIGDLSDYFDPDAVLLIRDGAGQHTLTRMAWEVEEEIPRDRTVYKLKGQTWETVTTDAGTLLFAPEVPTHEEVAEFLPDDGSETYVFTDDVSVSIDLQNLSATLDGLDPYLHHELPLTVFSGQLDADYWVVREGTSVRGLAPVRAPNTEIPCITLGSDGIATTKTLAEERLGIRVLSGMGETMADRFREAGYTSVEDIHNAPVRDIRRITGVGEHRATNFTKGSRAIVEKEVVRLTDDESLPRDVVHIDIETDGLTPTIIWQIGLYDPRTDDYRTFLQRNPSEKAPILREFGSWLRSTLDGRAVVAYNGWNFDFTHLDQFFVQHCPEYHDVWRNAYKFDPYDWAVRKNNAALPGRGNGLEEVAEALGYERERTGLDGATTAYEYQRYMQNPCEETEPDWERHTTYCREDVMGLDHLYECLLDSGRLSTTETNTNRPTDENTTQGTLFDY